MLLQGRLHGPESLSRELFGSALKLAANRDLVDAGREELGKRREEFAAQLDGSWPTCPDPRSTRWRFEP